MDDGPSPAAPSGPSLAAAPAPAPAVGGAMDIDDGATSANSASTRGKNRAKPTSHVPPEDLPAGRVIATWPMVDCAGDGCAHTARWRDCFEECIYTRVSSGVLGDDDDEFHVAYYCYSCMAV